MEFIISEWTPLLRHWRDALVTRACILFLNKSETPHADYIKCRFQSRFHILMQRMRFSVFHRRK